MILIIGWVGLLLGCLGSKAHVNGLKNTTEQQGPIDEPFILGAEMALQVPKDDKSYSLVSEGSSEKFLVMLNFFRSTYLDPKGRMAGIDFKSTEGHTIDPPSTTQYWSPIKCYNYDFELRTRLVVVRELAYGGNSRVILLKDKITEKEYVLKVYSNNAKYTSELNVGRLKGASFIQPICTMDVELPVKRDSIMDHGGYWEQEGLDDGGNGSRYKYVVRPGLLMEYIKGKTFDKYAYDLGRKIGLNVGEERPVVFDRIAQLSAELFLALIRIHAAGLIYHDMKPDNVLVTEDGHVKVIDFDSTEARTEAYKGSPSTYPPESWNTVKGSLHTGADWWAFGATISMVLANVCAGMYAENDPTLSAVLKDYTPFGLKTDNAQYSMNPPPSILSESTREFLFPFFSPDTDARRFHTRELQQKIKALPFFETVDWAAIEDPYPQACDPNSTCPYYKLTEEQIRKIFLANAKKTVGTMNSTCKLRYPQKLYVKEDLMMATDLEDSSDEGTYFKPQLVSLLIQSSRRSGNRS